MRNCRFFLGGGLIALMLVAPSIGLTQQANDDGNKLRFERLQNDIEALKAGQKAIMNELQEIKKLRSARGEERPPIRDINTTLSVAGAFSKGDTQATLTLVEFTDYQCPFCGRHVRETLPKLEQEYIATGKLKYVARDFPLDMIHPLARKASEAFWCANDQGKGEAMHDRLFANQQQLQPEALEKHAEALGLDVQAFKTCLGSSKYTDKINASLKEGQKVGVTGTPAFLLGYTQAAGAEVKAVKFLVGSLPFDTFKDNIDELLDTKK
jgi:protein-disulfide isomerase